MSFLLHLAALLGMTLVVFVQSDPGRPLPITISTTSSDRRVAEAVPVEIVTAEISGETAPAPGPLLASALVEYSAHRSPLAASLAPAGGGGPGTSSGPPREFGAGFELPKNAVQAGSFAAWWIPKVERFGEQVEPGQLPRVGQDYRIHVQIRVPDGRRTLKVDDLSGEIVGTDGYRQLIPDRAWVIDEKGELVRAVGGRSNLRVQGGLAEVVFKVDAAGQAGVRDTIRIRSRALNEEQTLTLEFTAADATSP